MLVGELVLEAAEVGRLGGELDGLGCLDDLLDGGLGFLEGALFGGDAGEVEDFAEDAEDLMVGVGADDVDGDAGGDGVLELAGVSAVVGFEGEDDVGLVGELDDLGAEAEVVEGAL